MKSVSIYLDRFFMMPIGPNHWSLIKAMQEAN